MGNAFLPRNRTRSKPWYERAGGARFQADKLLVEASFPTLQFRVDTAEETVCLEGHLELAAECGITTAIPTRVQFPRSYPHDEPIAFDAARRFQPWPEKTLADRHLGKNGECCLWLPPKSSWNGSDPNALRDFLAQLVVFFDRQLIYNVTGKWCGLAYDHGIGGYLEFIQEELNGDASLFRSLLPVIALQVLVGRNDRCPCGRAIKFKQCHLSVVENIQGRIGRDVLLQFRRFS